MSWRWWQDNVEKPVTSFFEDAGDAISSEWKNAGRKIHKAWNKLSPKTRQIIGVFVFVVAIIVVAVFAGVPVTIGIVVDGVFIGLTGVKAGIALGALAAGIASAFDDSGESGDTDFSVTTTPNENVDGNNQPRNPKPPPLPQPQETSDDDETANRPTAETNSEDSDFDIIDPHDSETDHDIADDDIGTSDGAQSPEAPNHTAKPIGSVPPSTIALPTDTTEQDAFEESDKENPSFEQPYAETTKYFGAQGDTESALGTKPSPPLEKSYIERSEKTSGGSDFYSTKSNNDYKTYFEFENPEEKILIYQSNSSRQKSPKKTNTKNKTHLIDKLINTGGKTADRIDAVLETAHTIKPVRHVPIFNKRGIKMGSRTYLTKTLDSSKVAQIAKKFSIAGDALSIGYSSYGYYSTNENFGSSHPETEEAGRKAFGVSASVGIGFAAGAVSAPLAGPFAPLVGLSAKELSGLYFDEVENQMQQDPYYQDYTRQYDRYLDYQDKVKAYWKDRTVENFSRGLKHESIIDRMGIPVKGEKILDTSQPMITQGYGSTRPLFIPKATRRKFKATHPLDPDNSLILRKTK